MVDENRRTGPDDIRTWIGEHEIEPGDIDDGDMLTYVHEWEDAHPEMVESAEARKAHHQEIEAGWRQAFEASRLTTRVELAP